LWRGLRRRHGVYHGYGLHRRKGHTCASSGGIEFTRQQDGEAPVLPDAVGHLPGSVTGAQIEVGASGSALSEFREPWSGLTGTRRRR
jgi:hypothetical protein